MLEIKFVRQNLVDVENALQARGDKANLEAFRDADQKRRDTLQQAETLRHKRNVVSEQVAKLKKAGEDADDIVAEMRTVSAQIKALDKNLSANEEIVRSILMGLPNIPHASVPVGKNENDNPVERKIGTPPAFGFEPLPHWDIGTRLNIFDFDRAAKITGARFPLYLGAGARLERALINFMLDLHTTRHGYTEILPPFIVNRTSMTATGQLPKFEEDLFKLEGWDYYLIPTAEVPVTNIYRGETLDEAQLPIRYTAFTPCFRSEAGSYGKDTRGLIRQHQFNKVELVNFTTPETSYAELETLLACAEKVLEILELP
jgi:seryl-tRNA synthetase